MSTQLRILATVAAFALAGAAQAIGLTGTLADYGHSAAPQVAARTIDIGPATSYVHVDSGETVTFTHAGRSFTWTFDNFPTLTNFELKIIAPAEFAASDVRVLVADNPLYRG